MAFKDTLRRIMTEKDVKAVELSRRTGLSEGVISEYLSGKKEPLAKTCAKIAAALDVTVDELLESGFTTTKKPPEKYEGLTEMQRKVLDLIEPLDDEKQRAVLDYIRFQKSQRGE